MHNPHDPQPQKKFQVMRDVVEMAIIITTLIITNLPPSFPPFSNFLYFLLEYNCFTMLHWFLPYNNVNQPYVYIYLLPLEPPSHPISTF